MIEVVSLLLVAAGVAFFVAGTMGLLRFPDPRARLHALAKADGAGLGFVVLGLLLRADGIAEAGKLLLVWAFGLVSATTVGQLLGRAAGEGER